MQANLKAVLKLEVVSVSHGRAVLKGPDGDIISVGPGDFVDVHFDFETKGVESFEASIK